MAGTAHPLLTLLVIDRRQNCPLTLIIGSYKKFSQKHQPTTHASCPSEGPGRDSVLGSNSHLGTLRGQTGLHIQSLWGQRLCKCLLQSQEREKTLGPHEVMPGRAGTQQQKCVWRGPRETGETEENQRKMYTSQHVRPPRLTQTRARQAFYCPLPSPSASPVREGSVTAASSPVPYNLEAVLSWGGERFDIELNLKWELLSGAILYILIFELKPILCLKVTF